MPHFDRKTVIVLGLALATGFLVIGSALAQIPDEFTNLKVLPKDIQKGELVGIMRNFAGALGQRCVFCHVPGPDPQSLEGMDFASDEPEHKRIARVMMKMTGTINSTLAADSGIENPTQVRCITCHRGVPEPKQINTIVLDVAAAEGLPAAQAKYRELREEYYGQAAYDFSAGPLNDVAETLAEQEDLPGAISVMQMNLEFHPDAAYSHILLGQLYAQNGDKELGIASLKKALELEPDNGWAKRILDRMTADN